MEIKDICNNIDVYLSNMDNIVKKYNVKDQDVLDRISYFKDKGDIFRTTNNLENVLYEYEKIKEYNDKLMDRYYVAPSEHNINYSSRSFNQSNNTKKKKGFLSGLFNFLDAVGDLSQSNTKKEDNLDIYGLEEHEKELIKKGEYDVWNFEQEELDEDDYYHDDDM